MRGRELSGTVLLAEDEPLVRLTLRTYLRDLKLNVLDAASGDQALAVARQHDGPIDVLLADITMPGLSGPALAARVRELRPRMPVVFMSAHEPSYLVDRGVVERGALLLRKPFDEGSLVEVLREAMGVIGRNP